MKLLKRIGGALALAVVLPTMARADAVLNEPSQGALETALAAGGRIAVNCDGTLIISNTIRITNNAYVDASGHRLTITSLSDTSAVRLFTVNTGANLSLINLTLVGGRSTNGGAIYNNRGFLTLENCVVSNHLAIGASGGNGARGRSSEFQSGDKGKPGGSGRSAYGGAIYNLLGTTIVNRCSFFTNSATAGDGGVGGGGGDGFARGGDGGNGGTGGKAQGGAIFNSGLLIISNSTFKRNGAIGGLGGTGGSNGTGGLVVGDLGHGGAGGSASGGAIFNTNRGRLFVYGSTFALNGVLAGDCAHAGSDSFRPPSGKLGPGSYGGAVANHGTNEFLNCTFFGNRSTAGAGGNGANSDIRGGKGGDGGNAYGGNLYSTKRVSVTNCTFFDGGTAGGANGQGGTGAITGNSGKRGARRGGNLANNAGTFILKNSLIAFAVPTNGYGTFKDAGFNLSSDRSMKLKGPGSMVNVDPYIGLLGTNGGLTETVPLIIGSPAINAGDTNFCLTSDQRGVSRPYDGRCDIGAYEHGLTLLPPIITSQPQSQTAQLGASVTFIVVAEGDPPLTYQWRRGTANTVNITNATGPVLTLTNVQSSDASTYSVVIANNSGTVTSSDATLSLISPVAIVQQPESITVFPGSNATFMVTASGLAPLFYQWYFNGMLIPGATLPTYLVVGAQDTNGGDYQVLVFNSFSSVTSAVAVLTVGSEPPTITTQPEDATFESGETATLSVVANGSQPLRYQWYQNITNVVTGATSPTLAITNAQPVHSGNYSVIVTNSLGSITSDVVVLTIQLVPPRIITQPASQTPCIGNDVEFVVVARGTEPIFYQWFRGIELLPNETNATLLIRNVQTTNAAFYTVSVTNSVGAVTSVPAELDFTTLPNITQHPEDAVVFQGNDVTLRVGHCPTPGPFTYQWTFESAETGEIIEIAGATNITLLLQDVEFSDAGSYTVTIANLEGDAVSEPAELSVSLSFEATRISTDPLVFRVDFEVPDDGVFYTLQRQDPDDPQVWNDLESYPGDGTEQTYTDNVPAEVSTPVYRIVPTL